MNKARVGEPARGFIPKLDAEVLLWRMEADSRFLCLVLAQNGVIILNPSTYMTCRKDGSLDETKEWITTVYSRQFTVDSGMRIPT